MGALQNELDFSGVERFEGRAPVFFSFHHVFREPHITDHKSVRLCIAPHALDLCPTSMSLNIFDRTALMQNIVGGHTVLKDVKRGHPLELILLEDLAPDPTRASGKVDLLDPSRARHLVGLWSLRYRQLLHRACPLWQ